MVFEKKRGRKKGSTTTGYSNLTKEEKVKYHKDAVHKHREKAATANPPSPPPTKLPSNASTPLNEEKPTTSTSGKRGRPPLEAAAMTPRTRSRRKTEQQRKRRKTERVSTVRRLLQLATWQKRKGANTEQEERDSDSSASEEELNSSPPASDVDDEQNTEAPPQPSDEALRKKYYRHRTVLQGLLPTNSMDSLKMMIYLVNLSILHGPLQIELQKIQIKSGDLSIRQVRYRVDKLLNRLPNMNETESKTLLRYWFGLLLDNVLVEQLLNDYSVVIPPEYIPQSITISTKAASIAKEMVTSRRNVSREIKNIGTMYVVRVAKECGLTRDNHKDIDHLASATSCTWRFARKVLYAIAENDEKSLYQRQMKNNSG